MAYVFRKWFPPTAFSLAGQPITVELKHLRADEMREVRARALPILEAIGEVDRLEEKTAEAVVAADKKVTDKLDREFLEKVFRDWVRNVTGLEDEAGQPLTLGTDLLECADDLLLFAVVLRLMKNGKVSSEEGKGSGSPSESGSAGGPTRNVSAFPAPSTVSVDGVSPSTATATTDSGPSGPRAISA